MMNGTDGLSANTTAILLLTAPLVVGNRGPQAQILTAGEYRKLAPCLASLQAQPANLLEPGADRLLAHCGEAIDEARLRALLNRGFLLSQAVERWQTRGIWVVSRADAAYPPLLRKTSEERCAKRALRMWTTRDHAYPELGDRRIARRSGTAHRVHAGNGIPGRARWIDRGLGRGKRR